MPDALIIFVRNPELGKVKTRIAATVGDQAALIIYKKLLQHTFSITNNLTQDKHVFYADAQVEDDIWSNGYTRHMQQPTDLGNRMKAAFELLFQKGYQKLVIIGSDCYELKSSIINNAFAELNKKDLVIGPAKDGGYYLLGMSNSLKNVFQNIDWSSDKVLQQTLSIIDVSGFSYSLLVSLNDVDTIEDVPQQWKEELGIQTTATN